MREGDWAVTDSSDSSAGRHDDKSPDETSGLDGLSSLKSYFSDRGRVRTLGPFSDWLRGKAHAILSDEAGKPKDLFDFAKDWLNEKLLFGPAANVFALALEKSEDATSALSNKIRQQQALATYKDEETLWQDVLARNPGSWMAHHNLANFLANHGRAQEAVVRYESAVRLKSDDFQAFNNLGVMLSRLGRSEDAIVNFERALAIRGDYDRARQNLIPEYRRLGDQSLIGVRDYNTARRSYLRLTQLTPSDAVAHYGLSVALIETGDVPQAAKELQTAVTLNPTFLAAYDLLARTLATRTPADGGNPDLALKAALQACALTSYSDPSRLDTLAMAYASADRFSTALATEQRALDLVRRSGSRDLLETLQAHSNLFRAGKPYREP